MSRPAAPSMPTEHQVKEAHKVVTSLYPTARIKGVGPDGVIFEYPEGATPAKNQKWAGTPFSGGKRDD